MVDLLANVEGWELGRGSSFMLNLFGCFLLVNLYK